MASGGNDGAPAVTGAQIDALAHTLSGDVEGQREDDVFVFRGIPFAAPPTGPRRFRPPQPVEAWAGLRDATEFGPAAPQLPSPLEHIVGSRELTMSEDCLYLNVWTPGLDDVRRPVLVWIHGGAFTTGAGSIPWYDGTSFARLGDVVVVTLNYRIGALGFLLLDGIVDGMDQASNLGILDQIAALRWVRDNIEAFGGDPDQVTVFGESAGAMSVAVLMGMPSAKGLFGRAILQSGAAQSVAGRTQAERITHEFLAEIDLPEPDAESLRAAPVDEILRAQGSIVLRNWGKVHGLPLQPVFDGMLMPQLPHDAIEDGSSEGMDVLIGTTRDEWRLFALLDPAAASLDRDELLERVTAVLGSTEAAHAALDVYAADEPEATPGDLWTAFQTDRIFRAPATAVAERHRGPTFMYLFSYCTDVMGGGLRSCHALEIPFVFNNLDAPGAQRMTGPVTREMQDLALAMHEAWIAFAREGRPRSPRLPEWPTYDGDRRGTMVFGEQPSIEDDPLSDQRRLWASSEVEV
ncbi:MAG: carboxylesterase/lipase family protein [Actinomycetota bacterium]